MLSFKNHTFLMVITFVLFSFLVFLSFFSTDGFINLDSSFYLKYASSFRSGDWFQTTNYFIGDESMEFLGILPMGYSFFTGLLMFLPYVDAAVASKLVNILFILILYWSLKDKLKNPWLPLVVFLFGHQFVLLKMSLGDLSFVVLSALLAIESTKIENRSMKLNCLILTTLIFLSFSVRFIGIYLLAWTGFKILVHWKENRRASLAYLYSSLISGTMISSYLLFNKHMTGYFTGVPRLVNEMNFNKLLEVFFHMINILLYSSYNDSRKIIFTLTLLSIFLFLSLVFVILKNYPVKQHLLTFYKENSIVAHLLLLAITYFLVIFCFGFLGVPIQARYMTPVTVFCLLALTCTKKCNEGLDASAKILLICAGVSIIFIGLAVPLRTHFLQKKQTYYKHLQEIQMRYQEIPDRSVVIMGPQHLMYLRPKIQVMFKPTLSYNGDPFETMEIDKVFDNYDFPVYFDGKYNQSHPTFFETPYGKSNDLIKVN